MGLARMVGAFGALFVVAGSCTNDFGQFDFDGAEATPKPSLGGSKVHDNTGGFGATPTGGRGGRAGSSGNGGVGGVSGVSGSGARGGTAGSGALGGNGNGAAGESGNGGEAPQGGAGAGATSGAGGAGASSCPSDQQECAAGCVPLTALDHCGSCEKACVIGFACEPSGCVCDAAEDCAAPVTGAGGNGGESAGGAAGDAQGGAASFSAQCVVGRCVCGVTECGENQRCQSDGSCG